MRRWLAARLGLALLAAGCASGPARAPVETPVAPVEPWRLPAAEENRQTLLRLQFAGAQGDASLRAVLRRVDAERYELAASDLLGRPVWTLSAAPGTALWHDHRARQSCALGDHIRLAELGLPELPPSALPALLLGRLPVGPGTSGPAPANAGGSRELHDAQGRRWSWREQQGILASWTLWQGPEPTLWWRRDGSGGVLSARRKGAQVRWQIVVSEPLTAAPGPPASPPGYTVGACDALALP